MNLKDENIVPAGEDNVYNQKCDEIYEFLINIGDSSDPEIIKAYLIEVFSIKGGSINNHAMLAHFIIHPKYRSLHEKFYSVLDQLIEKGLSGEAANFLTVKKCCMLLYRINDCLMPTNTTDSIFQIISDLNNQNNLLFNCHRDRDIQNVISSFCIYYENLMTAIIADITTEEPTCREFFGNQELQYYSQLKETFGLESYSAMLDALNSHPLRNKVMLITMQYFMSQGIVMAMDVSSILLPPETLFVTKISSDTYRIFEVPNGFTQKTEIANSILSFARENFALIQQFLETSKNTCKFSKPELAKISSIYHELVKEEFSQLSILPSNQNESSTQQETTYKIDDDIYLGLCKEVQKIISKSKKTAIKNLHAPTVATQIIELIAYSGFISTEFHVDKINPVFHKVALNYFKRLSKTMPKIESLQGDISDPVDSSTLVSIPPDVRENSVVSKEESADKLESSIDISENRVHSDREKEYNNYIQHTFRLYTSILNPLSSQQHLALTKQGILDQIEACLDTLDSSDFDKIESQFIIITIKLVNLMSQLTQEKISNKDRQEHSGTYTDFVDRMSKIAGLIEHILNKSPQKKLDYSEIHQLIKELKLFLEKTKLLFEKENLLKNIIINNLESEGKDKEANKGRSRVYNRIKKSRQQNTMTSKSSHKEFLEPTNLTEDAVQSSKTDPAQSTKNNEPIAKKRTKKKRKSKKSTVSNQSKGNSNVTVKEVDSVVIDKVTATTSEAMTDTKMLENVSLVPDDSGNQECNSESNPQEKIFRSEETTKNKDNLTACSATFFIAPTRIRKPKVTSVTLEELKKIQESTTLPHLKNVVLNNDSRIAQKEIELLNIYHKAFENGSDLLCAEVLLYLIDIKLGLYEKLVAYYHKLNPGEKGSDFYLDDISIAATAKSHRELRLSRFILSDDNNREINQAIEYRNLYRVILNRHQEARLDYICNEKATSFTS